MIPDYLPFQPEAEARHLERILPPHLDHRAFRRIPHNPDRYAISLLDGRVWDLYRGCYLTPQHDKDGRRRVRIAHPSTKARWIYCAVLLASTILGPPPSTKAQAHHLNEDPTDDRWDNVAWQTPKQNRARAAEHQAQKRRLGNANGSTELSDEDLAYFIRLHDRDRRKGLILDWEDWSLAFGVSPRQLRRIAKGQSRGERVAEIRRQIAQHASSPSPPQKQNLAPNRASGADRPGSPDSPALPGFRAVDAS